MNDKKHHDTIAAVCTPTGRTGGVSIIRVSGPNALTACTKISNFYGQKNPSNAEPNTILFGQIIDPETKKVIDQCLFCIFHEPKSFTGLDTVEINCHSNPLICQKILDLLFAFGVRQAIAGEFSQQAFQNGKIDLIQAEAICELVSANNSLALEKSMQKLKSGLSNEIANVYKNLLELLATLEASFEFLEEEERDLDFKSLVITTFEKLQSSAQAINASAKSNVDFNRGNKIVLAGLPNAGKSTLFNLLVGSERSIVSDIAGTTRDYIDAMVQFNGQLWNLVDTAGLRQTTDTIEQLGISRTTKEVLSADLVLCLVDPTNISFEQEKLISQMTKDFPNRVLLVGTKTDLVENCKYFVDIKTDPRNKNSIDQLKLIIWNKIKEQEDSGNSLFMLNQRQKQIIKEFCIALDYVRIELEKETPYELLITKLKNCAENLANLTGRNVQESVYDEVFSKFCVGK